MHEANQFSQLIEDSQRILITSHISPDPDAVSSVLLLGTTLKHNFPGKEVCMILEEEPSRDLSFLSGYSEIKFQSLLQATNEFKPDLFIMVDAMNLERCCRSDAAAVRSTTQELGSKMAVIDHHQKIDVEAGAIYINKQNPATAQELYEVLFYELSLQKPEGYAQTTLLGIISDTARHKYDNPRHRETFKVVSELIDAGASIEQLENKTERYTSQQLQAFAKLAANTKDSGEGYTYSFIDSEFDGAAIKAAAEIFTSQFARNFENNNWGFVVYPEVASGPDIFAVSFRSLSGSVDVAALANKLGGGGHKQAAGAKFQAKNIKDALQMVEDAISST